MKVSVLLPVYNGERHLSECLKSVLEQDFGEMEILIADNRSTDGSVKIIEQFAALDPRIRWWINPANLGMIGNHNACLREARGEYVKFMHADDKLLSPAAIRKLVAALDAHPTATLAGSRQHLLGATSKPTILSETSGLYEGRRLIVACLEQNTNLVGQPTLTLFRRERAQRGFDDRFTGHLDYEMWFHLLEQGDFVYLAENLATWRVHPYHQTAQSRNSGLKDYEHLRFLEIYYARPWLQTLATDRLRFTQIHYLQKKYGQEADALTSQMRARISPPGYAWQWLRHAVSRPVQKLARKFQKP